MIRHVIELWSNHNHIGGFSLVCRKYTKENQDASDAYVDSIDIDAEKLGGALRILMNSAVEPKVSYDECDLCRDADIVYTYEVDGTTWEFVRDICEWG